MIFDKFCGVVERWFPEYRPYAEDAKVFLFDHPAHNIGVTHSAEDMDLFTLPFRTTVIEDPATAVLFYDLVDEQIGLIAERGFIDILPVFGNEDAFNQSLYTAQEAEGYSRIQQELLDVGMSRDSLIIQEGNCGKGKSSGTGVIMEYSLNRMIICDKNRVLLDGLPTDPKQLEVSTKNASRNVLSAIEELLLVNSKKNFVLEIAPKNTTVSNKKIPRCHQRPLYSILDARTIRKKMGTLDAHERSLAEGRQRNSPIPHERRRHPRRLSTEGGHYKEDRVIIIPACWIGQSEAVVGNKIYKVRLDI